MYSVPPHSTHAIRLDSADTSRDFFCSVFIGQNTFHTTSAFRARFWTFMRSCRVGRRHRSKATAVVVSTIDIFDFYPTSKSLHGNLDVDGGGGMPEDRRERVCRGVLSTYMSLTLQSYSPLRCEASPLCTTIQYNGHSTCSVLQRLSAPGGELTHNLSL